jgi:hypothetical protein
MPSEGAGDFRWRGWAPCIPIHAAPSPWVVAVRVQGSYVVGFFNMTGHASRPEQMDGRCPGFAITNTWWNERA